MKWPSVFVWVLAGLITAVIVAPVAMLIGALSIAMKDLFLATYLFAIPSYIGYVLGYAYVRTKSTNLVLNNTRLGPLQFEATLRFRDMFILASAVIARIGQDIQPGSIG